MTLGDVPAYLREAAAVEPLTEGVYVASLSRDYVVYDYANGGYLQCVLANAAVAAASDAGAPHLFVTALSVNFISAPAIGRVTLHTDVRRIGRNVSFVHVTLQQDGLVHTEAVATVGTLSESSAVRYQSHPTPLIAPPQDCILAPQREGMTHHAALELRIDPDQAPQWEGTGDRGEIHVWMRMNDGGGTWDAWNVLFALDALWPATIPLGSSGWVPTLQLTSYVRRIPSSEWLRARQWIQVIADGLVDERCELFDESGELVGVSSQLAMVRFPQAE